MLSSILRRATRSVLAALIACSLPLAASAGTINIILSDMDVSYLGSTAGGSLFDAMGGFAGGAGAEATADDISTAVFELDGNVQGVLMNTPPDGDDIHADLRIINIGPTIVKNVFHPLLGNNGGGFGFDLFTDTGLELHLGITNISLILSNNFFFFTGSATVYGTQVLPFGLPNFSTSQPVQFSFTATMPAVNGALPAVSMAGGSGAFTISGVAVPEPATVGLLCLGLIIFGLALTRRQRLDAWAVVPARRN